MKLRALRNFYYSTEAAGSLIAKKGDVFEIPTSTQKDREQIFDLIQIARAVPADYPDPTECKSLRGFHKAFGRLGSFKTDAGEVRDYPAEVAALLVANADVEPTNTKLWSFRFTPEVDEAAVRRLHADNAPADERTGSWVSRWKQKGKGNGIS